MRLDVIETAHDRAGAYLRREPRLDGVVKTDVAIVGGGPAASAAAMHLSRHGIEAVLVEKVPFPRYHIGESLTAEAGGLLRGLGFEERMLGDGHPVKHGVKVYGGSSWWVPAMQRLPDGSLKEQITWQVRSERLRHDAARGGGVAGRDPDSGEGRQAARRRGRGRAWTQGAPGGRRRPDDRVRDRSRLLRAVELSRQPAA